MHDMSPRQQLDESLAAFGHDLSKWPAERASLAREWLLHNPAFRRAWERERERHQALIAHRDALDRAIADSGALERVRVRTLGQVRNPLAGFGWRRVAAAVIVAGMLGGALDLALVQPAAEADVVMLDPLYGLSATEFQ